MKIAVCINHVPDTASKINIASDGKNIDKTGITFVLNPYDEYAIEECLRLKEKNTGEVIALSLGGDAHKETLRKALAILSPSLAHLPITSKKFLPILFSSANSLSIPMMRRLEQWLQKCWGCLLFQSS
jgi:hypothetical protein